MKKLIALLPAGARIVLGLIFFVFGLNGFFNFLPVPPPPEGAATQFMMGLGASGFFFPLLKITEIVVGAALLANRFVPLALVVSGSNHCQHRRIPRGPRARWDGADTRHHRGASRRGLAPSRRVSGAFSPRTRLSPRELNRSVTKRALS